MFLAVYNIAFHPPSKFPGPLTRAAFAWPGLLGTCKGQYVSDVWDIHQKYGPVVRIAPDAVSFSTSGAWKGVNSCFLRMGKNKSRKTISVFQIKSTQFIFLVYSFPRLIRITLANFVASNDVDHARIRRIVSYGFSASALRAQDGMITSHIQTLMRELSARISTKTDIKKWFDILTFDIMSHLTFGESFSALPTGELDPFTVDLFGKFKMYNLIYLSREYGWINSLFKLMMKLPSVAEQQRRYFEGTRLKVEKRMQTDNPDEHDFMRYILHNNHENAMDLTEIIGTTTVLVNGGGQEMAVCLSTTLYFMLKNPGWLKRSQNELSADNGSSTTCIEAAINEAMRLHPPAAGNFQRRTGDSGIFVDGHFVPPNTSVGVNQYAAFHSPANFHDPERFAPERWLASPPNEFFNDNTAAFQPFSMGPRNCIGKK
ncbi:cytochrome P450 protein [Rutstroemia sp. NJR-2017a BVV2]|nr:cytochrome P450 protein [Rutstroemia sp. NJR-2017a BVV2]